MGEFSLSHSGPHGTHASPTVHSGRGCDGGVDNGNGRVMAVVSVSIYERSGPKLSLTICAPSKVVSCSNVVCGPLFIVPL